MAKIVTRIVRVSRKVPRRIASLLGKPDRRFDGTRIRDSWDRRWGDDNYHPRFEIEEADLSVRRAVEDGWFSERMSVLDIGCGAGHNAAWLAEEGLETVGIDFSIQAIERARDAFAGPANLTFKVVDVSQPVAEKRTFDAVVDRGCIHGIDTRYHQNYIDNLNMWTVPGSRYLLIWRNKDLSGEQVVSDARSMLERSFALVSSDPVNIGGMYTDEPLPAMAMRFLRSA